MTDLEHLSNEELVSTFQHLVGINQIYNKNIKKEINLKKEILRRLNEPWRIESNTKEKLSIDREHYKWMLNQIKLKIMIALKIMDIHGEDKEGIEVQNEAKAKLKEIEELYRE